MNRILTGGLLTLAMAHAMALPLRAQTAVAAESPALMAARAALAECLSYAEGDEARRAMKDESRAAFERAERAFRSAAASESKNPDVWAGLGETLSRCGIPHASMTSIMGVVEQSTEVLEKALQLDPQHWQARFILAMNNFNMPAFLNRTGVAIRELETLMRQQAGRADRAHYALTYLYLGDAYQRSSRKADAQAAFAAGAKLFPANAELQQRARDAGVPDSADVAYSSSPDAGAGSVHALAPLRVEAAQHQLEDARSGTSLKRLDIYTMPGGTGEMMQTLQTLPGVTRAGDGADLYVRGGEPEETPVFINGGRLSFPGRWEGLSGSSMGVLDASVLSRAFFSAGGYSAKYGNALSGVVDVETQGRPAEGRWRAGVNMVSLGASVFRPVTHNAGAWGTVMLTDVSLVTRMQGVSATFPDVPQSYQAVVGGSVDVTPQLELKAVALGAGDRSARIVDVGGYNGAFSSAGQTQHGALSARWLRPDARVGVEASLTASRRAGGYDFGVLQRDRTDDAVGARVDGDVILPAVRVRGGVELTRLAALTSGVVPVTGSLSPGSPTHSLADERASTYHAGGYVEAERPIAGALIGVLGLRVEQLPGESEITLDPRGALAYTSGDWTLRAAGGVFQQGRWRRTYRLPDGGAPSGVATRARHLIIGGERGGEPAVRVEAYTKWYDGYEADDGAGPATSEGLARGVDAMVRWQRQARLNGWITYSLLDAELTLEDGDAVPAKYDVTHSITGVARLALTDAWELGSTVRYATGRPYTPVTGSAPSAEAGWPADPVFGLTNGDRLPQYFRVDGRITRYQKIGGQTGVFYLEMLDLNGRRNVVGYQYNADYSERTPVESFFARRTFVAGAELNFQ